MSDRIAQEYAFTLRVPPELDQARLLRMQLQPMRRQPLPQFLLKPPGLRPVLKAEHRVVGVPHDEHISGVDGAESGDGAGDEHV